jgi:hypothetical protein
MASWILARGLAGAWTVTLRDSDGAVVTSYLGTEAIAGTVWGGDDRVPLLTLSPTWDSAPDGTVTVPIPAAQSGTLEPGEYGVDVYLADMSANFYRGSLSILPSAGTDATPFSYATYQQMLAFAGQVGRLQDLDTGEALFAPQLAQASTDFDRLVLNRYQPQPGRSMRYVSSGGTSPGAYLVWSPGPGGVDPPTRQQLAGFLGTAAVVVNADLIECVAQLALAQIYLGQPGRQNPYREAGEWHRAAAMDAFRRCFVELDTDGDGVADLRVDQDCIWMS